MFFKDGAGTVAQIPFSVLDLSPIPQGQTASDAFRNSADLARHAERLGYQRYWMAEHHNMPGIASAATSVVIGHVAAATKTIRVGAGGIMLPNHSPLVIAEQFGTLEALFPGRIDLGLGRAPGSDMRTAHALRKGMMNDGDSFPQDVRELQAYFQDAVPGQAVQAVPGAGLNVPLWILGSSLFGAQLAAAYGLPYAFASHFAPQQLMSAVRIYRQNFMPSEQLAKPYVMVGINVTAAETDEEAKRLFTSVQQQFINLRRGTPGKLPPPVDNMNDLWSPMEAEQVAQTLSRAIVGNPETVKRGLADFLAEVQPDEVIAAGQIYDHAARVRSFEILAEARNAVAAETGVSAA